MARRRTVAQTLKAVRAVERDRGSLRRIEGGGQREECHIDQRPSGFRWKKPEKPEFGRGEIQGLVEMFVDDNQIKTWGQLKKQLRKNERELYSELVAMPGTVEGVRTWFVQRRSQQHKAWKRLCPELKEQKEDSRPKINAAKEGMYQKILRDCFGFGKGKAPPNGAWVTVRMNELLARMNRDEQERFESCWDAMKRAGVITVQKAKKDRISVTVQTGIEVAEKEMGNAIQRVVREEQSVNPQFRAAG